MDNKKFGQFISELRKELNYTQKQVADKIHVTDKAISKWENGKGLPDISNIEALADVYSVSVGEIMQCKLHIKNELKETDVKEIIDNTLEIAHYQKQLRKYKMFFTIFFVLIGAGLIISGMYFMNNPFMMFDNNGSASYFIIGKVSSLSCWIALITGVICVAAGIFKSVKENVY